MSILVNYFFVFCLYVCFFAPCAFSLPNKTAGKLNDASFEAKLFLLQESFFQLSKNDSAVDDKRQWEVLSGKVKNLEKELTIKNREEDQKTLVKTIFLSGRIARKIFLRKKEVTFLNSALLSFEQIETSYPFNALADDALLAIADLQWFAQGKLEEAEKKYRKIMALYPNGDAVAQASKRLSDLSSSKVTNDETAKPQIVVAIDPGHGGDEDGALGVGGILEKDVVLNISMFLYEMLKSNPKIEVVLTRARDETLSLEERTKIANQANANLFVSIHANASKNKTAFGIETYYLDNTEDQASLKLAERENANFSKSNNDLSFIISDLIQNAKLYDSVTLAHKMHDTLYSRVSSEYRGVKNLGVKKAPFYVLVGAHMPCVLVEVSFIDHYVEGERLGTLEYQKLIAEALFKGILGYLDSQTIKSSE
jgi:N-acetylmuramoyl-L-alanine amidase